MVGEIDKPPPPNAEVIEKPGEPGEPPVVARLIVEIRSDGTRTIARGALQDASIGQEVAIKAEGTTPLALAASLMRSLFSAPLLGRVISRALTAAKPVKKTSER